MNNTPDIMTFLLEQYKAVHKDPAVPLADEFILLPDFIDFAKKYLATNQPINVVYLHSGIGVRLQQGQIVCFSPQQVKDVGMRDEGIPITRPQVIPGLGGINDMFSIPITGAR